MMVMFVIVKVRLGSKESEQVSAKMFAGSPSQNGAAEQATEETSGCASSQKCCNLL